MSAMKMKWLPGRPAIGTVGLVALLAGGSWAAQGRAQTSIFSVQHTPNPTSLGNTFTAVAAIGGNPNDVWAVGFKGQNEPFNEAQTLTAHWNGTAWTVIPSPNVSKRGCTFPDSALTAVSGAASDDVWAVGYASTCAEFNPLIMHWDGLQWSLVPSPRLSNQNNNQLNGVFAVSSDDVYAVGTQANAANSGNLTLIEHWDGTQWRVQASPNLNRDGNYLLGVSGTSASDLWAVGEAVAPNTPIKTLVEHFDGTKWSLIPSPNPLTGASDFNILTAVTATSPSDATAVGFVLDSAAIAEFTLVEHWDGRKWTVIPSANASNTVNKLLGVSALSPTDIYAAGFFIDNASLDQEKSLVEHFDGASWSVIPSPATGRAQNLNGVFALPGTGDVWITGAFSFVGDDEEFGFLIAPRTSILFTPVG